MCRMKVRAAVSAITILILPMLAVAASRTHEPATPPGSIAGTVRSSNSAVADATVTIWRDGKQVAAVPVTGDSFTFSGPEGTYEVQASAPHYKPAVTTRVTVVVHSGRETWVNLVLVAAP